MIGVIDKSSRSACKIDHCVQDRVEVKVDVSKVKNGRSKGPQVEALEVNGPK